MPGLVISSSHIPIPYDDILISFFTCSWNQKGFWVVETQFKWDELCKTSAHYLTDVNVQMLNQWRKRESVQLVHIIGFIRNGQSLL